MTQKQKDFRKKKAECKRIYKTSDLTGEEIAKIVGVSSSTFWRWKNEEGWLRPKKEQITEEATPKQNSSLEQISESETSISIEMDTNDIGLLNDFCRETGINNISTLIHILLKQVIYEQKLPFIIKSSNFDN